MPTKTYPAFFLGSFSINKEQNGYDKAYVAPKIIWDVKILRFRSEMMIAGPK